MKNRHLAELDTYGVIGPCSASQCCALVVVEWEYPRHFVLATDSNFSSYDTILQLFKRKVLHLIEERLNLRKGLRGYYIFCDQEN